MKIDAYLTPSFNDNETCFDNSIVVMFDVLRAGTTICSALYNGAKEIIATESTERAVNLYSNLSKESRFMGGEHNGLKLSGFDAGNSPLEYTSDKIQGKTIILSTTNGTKLFQKAKFAKLRIIGSFTNFSLATNYLKNEIEIKEDKNFTIFFMCAGNSNKLSFEDTLCAGAFINSLYNLYNDSELSDSALAAKELYNIHSDNIKEFLKNSEHANSLKQIGFDDDITISLSFDIYPVVPIISNNIIKKAIV